MKRTIENAVESFLAKWHKHGLEGLTREDLASLEEALIASRLEDDDLMRLAEKAKEAYDELLRHADLLSAASMAKAHLEEVSVRYETMQSQGLLREVRSGLTQRPVLRDPQGEEAQAGESKGSV